MIERTTAQVEVLLIRSPDIIVLDAWTLITRALIARMHARARVDTATDVHGTRIHRPTSNRASIKTNLIYPR